MEGKIEPGIALLRRTVTANPDTTLATEAQCRLGRYYFDSKRWDEAEYELGRCRRLPGCDAFDEARTLLQQIGQQRQMQTYHEKQLVPQQRQKAVTYRQLRAEIAALHRGPVRPDLERRFAARLLHDLPWDAIVTADNDSKPEAAAVLASAAGALHTPVCRYALGFAALAAGADARYRSEPLRKTYVAAALAYLHGGAPAPLRAGALGLALSCGYLSGKPTEAMPLIRPFLKPGLFTQPGSPGQFTAQPGSALDLLLTAPGEGRPTFIGLPDHLFMEGVKPTRNAIVHQLLRASRIKEAFDLCALFPQEQGGNDMDGLDIDLYINLRQALTDSELPALSLFLVADGLKDEQRWAEANAKWIALADRYPRSVFAPLTLGEVVSYARQSGAARLAEQARQRLLHDFPESHPTLCLQLQAAFQRGDLPQTQQLLTQCTAARDRIDENIRIFFQDCADTNSITYSLSQYRKMHETLKPLLDAAADPKLDTVPMLVSDGKALTEGLLKALPARQPEVYLTLAPLYTNAALARRFLERFPDHPRAGEAWKQLLGNENMVTPGAFDLGFPASARWLAPFIDRGPDYPYRDAATTLLTRQLATNYYGSSGLKTLSEEVRMVAEMFPGARIVRVAEAAQASALLNCSRPEAALPCTVRALDALPDGDLIRAEVLLLRTRALAEIAAKHAPEWQPLWSVGLRPFNAKDMTEAPPPLVASGLLLASEPDTGGARQIVALECANGQRRWTSTLTASVIDLAVSPADSRLYALQQDGLVVCLDLQNGRSLWSKSYVRTTRLTHLDGLLVAAGHAIVYGDNVGVAAINPRNGALLWQHADWRPVRLGITVMGKPAVLADTVIYSDTASVIAFNPATGALRWRRDYPAPPPPDPNDPPFRRRVRPTLFYQPVSAGEGRLAVMPLRPKYQIEVLNSRTGAVEASADPSRFASGPNRLAAGGDQLIEWDANGQNAVRHLPDLAVMPVRVPGLRWIAPPPIDGHTLYLCAGQDAEVLAIDLRTGAVTSRCAVRGQTFGAGTVLGDGKLFTVGFDGTVNALPLARQD